MDLKERGAVYDVDPDYDKVKTTDVILKLDLACGERKEPGFIGVDHKDVPGVDVVCDLENYPWDIESNSVFEIRCSHYIEHTKDLKSFMEECYRILVNGGIMTLIAPYYTSIRAFQDYTHVRPISENTFIYFNQPWLKSQKLSHYGVECDFDIDSIKYIYNSIWEARGHEAREWARVHYNNVVADVITVLRAVKPRR